MQARRVACTVSTGGESDGVSCAVVASFASHEFSRLFPAIAWCICVDAVPCMRCCSAIICQPLLIRSNLTQGECIGHAGNMAGFSSALLTRKSFLSGSAKVGRSTNGAKTFALFKKAQKQVKQATGPAKQTAKKVKTSSRDHDGCSTALSRELTLCQSCRPTS